MPPPLDERRPAFARDFPHEVALDALVRAFAEGDYARVRAEAPKLAASAEDEEVRRAAKVLRAQLGADPLAVWLFVIAAALLVFLTAWWVAHGHPPPAQRPAAPPATTERVP